MIRRAEARARASMQISSSIRLSLVGVQVDCSTKQSLPRTFSINSIITSPSEKRPTLMLPRGMFRRFATAAANCGLALPAKIIR